MWGVTVLGLTVESQTPDRTFVWVTLHRDNAICLLDFLRQHFVLRSVTLGTFCILAGGGLKVQRGSASDASGDTPRME